MFLVKNLPHSSGEGLAGVGLGKKCDPTLGRYMADDGVVWVAGDKQHLHFGMQRGELLGQHESAQLWHYDVAEQQVNGAGIFPGYPKRVLRAGAFQNAVTKTTQELAC